MRQTLPIIALLAMLATSASAQSGTGDGAAWAGRWHGTLVNLPARPNARTVEVTRTIGPLPVADSTCTTFRTEYREDGVLRGTKDYRLCRGAGATDWYVDEGDGTRLAAQWLGDVLVTPFKVDRLLLIAQTRVRGDAMDEEILTVDDQPATTGVLPLRARSLQRLELRRVSAP